MITFVRTLALAITVLAAGGLLAADVVNVDAETLLEKTRTDKSLVILDVRTPQEYAQGHVPGAVNIPYDKINARIGELLAAKDKEVVLYCHSGARAAIAAQTLKAQGFEKLLHLDGDIVKWNEEGRPTKK